MADWHKSAACLGVDPNVFYPAVGYNAGTARRICSFCPVIMECLDEAIAEGDVDYGIRAGLSARERRRVAAARNRENVRRTVESRRVEREVRIRTEGGNSAQDIAAALGISRRSVVRHRGRAS